MRKCMMNAISMGCIAVGSFLMGGALGLALSKDESDIFDENCIKLEDIRLYSKKEYEAECTITEDGERFLEEAQDSYDRMTKELYGPDRAKIIDPYSHVLDEEASEKLLDDLISEEEYDEAENKSVETTIRTVHDAGGREYSLRTDSNINNQPVIINKESKLPIGHIGIASKDNETISLFKQTSEGLEEVTEPYIISEDDYWDPNQYPEFAQENLVYYAKDDVLTTERDEVITDIDDVVGPHALTSFGSMCLDKDTVFVRNIRLGMDYEITRDEGSYQEIVLGYSDEEEEAAYKKAKQYFKQLEKEEEGATT